MLNKPVFDQVEVHYSTAMEDLLFPLNPHIVYSTAVCGPLFYYDFAIKTIQACTLGNVPVMISFKENLEVIPPFLYLPDRSFVVEKKIINI